MSDFLPDFSSSYSEMSKLETNSLLESVFISLRSSKVPMAPFKLQFLHQVSLCTTQVADDSY